MSQPLQDLMESKLAELDGQRARLREFEQQMAATTGTAHSKNRMVSATVDKRGRLTELTFEGTRYRTIAPAELASIVLKTVQEAQDDAATKARSAATELLPDTFGLLGLSGTGAASGGAPAAAGLDLDGMFQAALKLFAAPVLDEEPASTRTEGRR